MARRRATKKRSCRNYNTKTKKFQKRKTTNTKRVCYNVNPPCRVQSGPNKGKFMRCRKGSKRAF